MIFDSILSSIRMHLSGNFTETTFVKNTKTSFPQKKNGVNYNIK